MRTTNLVCKILINIFLMLSVFFLKGSAQTNPTATLNIRFRMYGNGSPALYDTLIYINKAGNHFEINQVQFFISEVTLYKHNAGKIMLSAESPWHYIDKDIPRTLDWRLPDKLSAGEYDSISFTFGLSEKNNRSFMFRNPPENYMAWPGLLGGGYHYMKINLKYLDSSELLSNFNCHLGIGQIRNSEGKITGFVQNYFHVTLPNSSFRISGGETKEIEIIMNIEKWFDSPNQINFNDYGGIMENEAAMKSICENGRHVFSVKIL